LQELEPYNGSADRKLIINLPASEALALQLSDTKIRCHEYSILIHLCFAVSEFPFFIRSRNAFVFSCDFRFANCIGFGNCDSFACRATTHGSAFQKSKGTRDWTCCNGRPGDGYRD
jgi:hypothetical protein